MAITAELHDGTRLEFPDGTDPAVIQRTVKGVLSSRQEGKSFPQWLGESVRDLGAGAIRGAGSIGATLLAPVDAAARAAGIESSVIGRTDRRESMTQTLGDLGADTNSTAFAVGKLGAEIAGTAGLGGGIAGAAGRLVPATAAKAAPLLDAIRTAGMTAGGAGLGVRSAGGAINGLASAGLVNPGDAGTGAAVGAALPGGLKLAGMAGRAVTNGARQVANPQSKYVDIIANVAGKNSPQELKAALDAAGIQALPKDALQSPILARLVAEDQLTVPQLLNDPAISQLQRTLMSGGSRQFSDVAGIQNRARMDALRGIAPVSGSLQQAAENVGSEIASTIPAARKAEKSAVSRLFEGVDPFDESAVLLPMDQLRGAKSKYLSAGTFGAGGKADEALRAAADIGEVVVPATAGQRAGQSPMTLAQAVRAAGGINLNSTSTRQFTGELKDLSQRVKGITSKSGGVSIDRMAEKMREAGYTMSEDPAQLIDDLFNNPHTVSLADAESAASRAVAKAAAEGADNADLVLPRVASFKEVQSFRSSLSEAAKDAKLAGRNKENGALVAMIKAVDGRIDDVANGRASQEEFFSPDMVDAWKKANAAHAKYKQRFETGPQSRLWKQGGDGLPAMQGAEVAGAFYGPSRSQVENVQGFKRLVDGADAPMQSLKSYAVTDAAGQVDALGNLTNAKFGNWRNARTGANRELFNGGENAVFDLLAGNLKRSDQGLRAGMGAGSDTAAKLQQAMSLGLLDNRLVDMTANKIPLLGSFTGPMLSRLREQAKADRVNALSDLLSDPARLYGAIGGGQQAQSMTAIQAQRLVDLLSGGGSGPVRFGQMAQQGALRAAPVALSGQ